MNTSPRFGGNRRFPRRIALALGIVVAVTAVAAPQAMAQTPDKDPRSHTQGAVAHDGPAPAGFTSWTELLTVQDRLVRAADRITEAAQGSQASGFAGIVLDPEHRRMRLYWKGAITGPTDVLVRELGKEVVITTMHANYSAQELAAEVAKITAKPGGVITSVTPAADGSGLIVGVSTPVTTGLPLGNMKVPVTTETIVRPTPASHRWDDSSPWWGGAAWQNDDDDSACSLGFAVWDAGVPKMLTAGHCGSGGDLAEDATGDDIGHITDDSDGRDVALITAPVSGRVYNNSRTSSGAIVSEFSNPVIGTASSYVGMWVCTSGAYSGTRCNIKVQATAVNTFTDHWIYNLVRAVSAGIATGTNAAGHGDSGGPVEVVNPANNNQVSAAGVISLIGLPAPCTGYVTSGRTCSSWVYYSPWSNVRQAFGFFEVGIVTG